RHSDVPALRSVPTADVDVRVQLPTAAPVPLQSGTRQFGFRSALIRVSARKLNLPGFCACCMGVPDSSLDTIYVRRTGKRQIKTETHRWTFPYCSSCQRHVRKAKIARNFANFLGWFLFCFFATISFAAQSVWCFGFGVIASLVARALIMKWLFQR